MDVIVDTQDRKPYHWSPSRNYWRLRKLGIEKTISLVAEWSDLQFLSMASSRYYPDNDLDILIDALCVLSASSTPFSKVIFWFKHERANPYRVMLVLEEFKTVYWA